MTRNCTFACLLTLLLCRCLLAAQSGSSPDPAKQPPTQPSTDPAATSPSTSDTPDIDPSQLPEEDESLKPKVYPFNPMEAERDIKVGDFYMRKGTPSGYRAAAGRFGDASKYNPSSAEAFFKLGEAEQKLKHVDKAKTAFGKALKLASPESKIAKESRKKVASLS